MNNNKTKDLLRVSAPIVGLIVIYLVFRHNGSNTTWLASESSDPTVSFTLINTLGRTNIMRMDIGVRSDGVVVWRPHDR